MKLLGGLSPEGEFLWHGQGFGYGTYLGFRSFHLDICYSGLVYGEDALAFWEVGAVYEPGYPDVAFGSPQDNAVGAQVSDDMSPRRSCGWPIEHVRCRYYLVRDSHRYVVDLSGPEKAMEVDIEVLLTLG